jgi:methionyl aminopeptidase
MKTSIKTPKEIDSMRISGQMLGGILRLLRQKVEPGLTTKELADIAAKELKALGGKPAFLGYFGFPDVLCVSLNDEIIHGIPSQKRIINDGDLVSMDFGVVYQGMITDAAITTVAGQSSSVKNLLLKATKESLLSGVDSIKPSMHIGDLSSKIQQVLDKYKLGIVREYVGHGVGHNLHEEPNIPNIGTPRSGPILHSGMTIAVEPMATLGSYQTVVDDDGWTVRTKDGSLSAHFEHTLLITEAGAEILTVNE